MSVHVLIKNTLVQHKMVKNLHMALCSQNQEYRGYGLTLWAMGFIVVPVSLAIAPLLRG